LIQSTDYQSQKLAVDLWCGNDAETLGQQFNIELMLAANCEELQLKSLTRKEDAMI
jgi:hypothetical protein